MPLRELDLGVTYSKGRNSIAQEFYMPCLSNSVRYDRAVGFFSSAIYVIAWPSLKDFVKRGGRIRIICSPLLSRDDITAIDEGYSVRDDESLGTRFQEEIRRMLELPYLQKPTRVLASLVALEIVSFRIVAFKKEIDPARKRLFHDKVGIFHDDTGEIVVFRGSMNETWSGLSNDGNLEAIDVFLSWSSERDKQRVSQALDYFEDLWFDRYPDVVIREFPDLAKQELLRAADEENWPNLVDQINDELDIAKRLSADKSDNPRTLRPHQVNALLQWFEKGRRGIFEHATGSGKTYTALSAIRDAINRGDTPLIIVPSQILLDQWNTELTSTLDDLEPKILKCGGGSNRWKTQNLLHIWTRPTSDHRIVLTTVQTASSKEFIDSLFQGDHILLVADEVHTLGSPVRQQIFEVKSGPRLGLSATPRRAGDPEGTQVILDYFEGIVPPPYTLADAIGSGTLTPYMYYPQTLELTEDEQEEWNQITSEIIKLSGLAEQDPLNAAKVEGRINQLRIRRAKVLKSASQKIPIAVDLLKKQYQQGQRWIVYCDSLDQLHSMLSELRKQHLPATEYHYQMAGDRIQTLRHFDLVGGIVVAIKCLDEGVDIPSVSHAMILASSKNPREFIQRRGRVLRRSNNKFLAFIHDLLVVPFQRDDEDEIKGASIIRGELARAVEFGRSARNPSAVTELARIADRFGVDIDMDREEGLEDEED